MQKQTINITEGSIMRQIVRLAWPAVGSMFLHTAMSITDAIWVGRLGADQMAAVISSMFVIWIIYSLLGIAETGTVAVLSRHYGAKNMERVAHAGRQAVLLGLGFSIIVGALGLAGSGFLFDIMNTTAVVKGYGVAYLRIIFAVTISIFMAELLNATFRATGDTKTPLIVGSISIGINLILDPLLIFGWGPFPRLEVIGAGIATASSYTLGLLLYLLVIKLGKLTFAFDWHKLKGVDWPVIWQMAKVGTPGSISGVIFSIVYLFLTRITASFGTEAVAALGIGNRLESFSYMLCFGFYMAVATLVGQNLGAGKPERAAKSAWYAVAITLVITTIIGLAFILFPRSIASIFIADPKVQEMAVDYLMILALSQPSMAILIVLEGAFAGASDTMPPMIVSIVYAGARLPIALWLTRTQRRLLGDHDNDNHCLCRDRDLVQAQQVEAQGSTLAGG
jgi:putative MATE family efflux protein